MGWYTQPATEKDGGDYCDPGTCQHKDCAAVHKQLETPCALCGELIQPGRKMYYIPGGEFVHAACQWRASEEQVKRGTI